MNNCFNYVVSLPSHIIQVQRRECDGGENWTLLSTRRDGARPMQSKHFAKSKVKNIEN